MTKKNTSNRIYYTLFKGKRCEICLGNRYSPSVVAAFRDIVQSLVDTRRYGTFVPTDVLQAIETLPESLRLILHSRNLIAKTTVVRIPTIDRLLYYYERVEPDSDKKLLGILREYFGSDTPIDTISPLCASGLRRYLTVERAVGRGRLQTSTVEKMITIVKLVFEFAVEFGYLESSPMDTSKRTVNRRG